MPLQIYKDLAELLIRGQKVINCVYNPETNIGRNIPASLQIYYMNTHNEISAPLSALLEPWNDYEEAKLTFVRLRHDPKATEKHHRKARDVFAKAHAKINEMVDEAPYLERYTDCGSFLFTCKEMAEKQICEREAEEQERRRNAPRLIKRKPLSESNLRFLIRFHRCTRILIRIERRRLRGMRRSISNDCGSRSSGRM